MASGLRAVLFGSGSPLSTAAFDALAGAARLVGVVVPAAPAWSGRGALRALLARRPLVRRARRARIPLLYFRPGGSTKLEGALRRLAPDLLCVASFPRLLPAGLLSAAPLGAVGLHPSLLPRHRGPEPLFWTYFDDDRETGVTLHRLDAGEDTGEILAQEALPVPRGQRVEELYATLAACGARLLPGALAELQAGRAQGRPQDAAEATREPLPRPGTWRIDFETWAAERVWHFLSGLGGRHGRLLQDGRGRVVAHGAARSYTPASRPERPGSLARRSGGWRVACRDGFVDVDGPRMGARLRAVARELQGGWLGRLALLGISSFTTLVLAELVLSERLPPAPSRLSVIESLRASGVAAERPVIPWLFVHGPRLDPTLPDSLEVEGAALLPLGGVSGSAVPFCREAGEWMVYRNDERGFLNPPGAWRSAPVEIVAVGDSFAFGECVPTEQGLVERLRTRHPATVNLAYPGNGPLTMLAGLREYAPYLRPAVVLWFYCSGNDLADLRLERRHRILVRYLEPGFSQGLLETQEAMDSALVRYAGERITPLLLGDARPTRLLADTLLLRHIRARMLEAKARWTGATPVPPDFEASADDLDSYRMVLDLARAEAAAVGARLLFVYLPSWGELHGNQRSREIAARTREELLELVRDSGVGLVDVRQAFGSRDAETLFACRTCHYTAEAYRLAAEAVLASLAGAVASR